ncbi:hypothetical protein ETAA8_70620 [Anatilimnocola aggregata]|uniref:Uncharacterized protein n=1 Tax=Anatilimnocola aggregata TaxID=2528021 RepID=A0A517YNW4_9BACT|nr:hypothetical protein [Anatilimnocola aggregata]QDU31900.1 hypothetical protein ETAA8_70620 [Anatilimnocola aggregata]
MDSAQTATTAIPLTAPNLRASVAARRAARAALPAVLPPPLPSTNGMEPLPKVDGEVPRRFEPSESVESSTDWLHRNTSFAVSMVVHLLLLIGLALWGLNDTPKRGHVELSAAPTDAEPEPFVQMLAPAEPVADLDEILSQMSGDMTDLPDADKLALENFSTTADAPGSFDFSRDVIPNGQLMQELGGGVGNGEAGGGTGGLGAGLEIGNMLQFVERLQRAGAKSGDVQISLIWDNYNDLDLHVITPRNENIFFGHRRSRCKGELDVDMNAGAGTTREPVENVYWGKGKAPLGKFRVGVHHFRNHGDADPTPFELRIVVDGKTEIVTGEISAGSPRLIMYEFERKASDRILNQGPASQASPSPNDESPLLSRRRFSPANALENILKND